MMMQSRRALVLSALLLIAMPLPAVAQDASSWRTVPAERLLVVETSKGRVLIELFPDVAPAHVERVTTLADQVWINGVAVQMTSRQTELRDRYLERLQRQQAR